MGAARGFFSPAVTSSWSEPGSAGRAPESRVPGLRGSVPLALLVTGAAVCATVETRLCSPLGCSPNLGRGFVLKLCVGA